MKILAVSDRVLDQLYASDVKQRYDDIDLVIGCGDLPFYYLEFLLTALEAPLVYVKGNHDQGPQYTADGRTLVTVDGGQNIHKKVVHVKGLLIAGLEGSMRYRPEAPLMYSEGEMLQQVSQLVMRILLARIRYGRFPDILVTHSPPFGIQDRPDVAHSGFKSFRRLITLFKPRYLLHGHIHIYQGNEPRFTRFEETTVINVYPRYTLDFENPTLGTGVVSW